MKKVLCIMGPTGAGKTATAINLAKEGYPIRVINTDSRQIYRDFPIISAQPSSEEMAACEHRLYGYLEIHERTSAGEWIELATKEINEAHEQGFLPVLVGGTGFYFKALLDGIVTIPDIPEDIHQKYILQLEEKGSEALHQELEDIDPIYASKIHPRDKQRVTRALEVFESTGKRFSEWHAEGLQSAPYDVLRLGIGLPLTELTPLLYKRTDLMLQYGALEEARKALAINNDLNAPAWTGIGCREVALHLQGEYDLTTCMELWSKNTRAYAKRQWTWFRADDRIQWFRPEENSLELVKRFIG